MHSKHYMCQINKKLKSPNNLYLMQLFSSEESEVTAYIIKFQQSSRVLFFLKKKKKKDAKFTEIKLRAEARSLCSKRLEHCPSAGGWIHEQ